MKEIMEISLTLFNSIFDNKTVKRLTFKAFDAFDKALYDLVRSKVQRIDLQISSTANL